MPAPPPQPYEMALMEAMAKQLYQQGRLQLLPFYLGGFFDQLLLGLAVSQTVSYLRFVKRDRPYIVAIVFLAMAGTLAASIVILVWMTHLFVWGFGQYLPFDEVDYMVKYASIDIAVIMIVQIFFIDRACRLWKTWWLCIPLGILALTSLVFGCLFMSYTHMTYYHLLPEAFADPKMNLYGYGWLGLTVGTDLAITALIVAGLWKSRTGWKHTDSIIKGVIARSVDAQIPALILAILTVVLWARYIELSVFFIMLHTKVYVLGLLMTLNFRIGQAEGSGVYVSRHTESHRAPSNVYHHSVNRPEPTQYLSHPHSQHAEREDAEGQPRRPRHDDPEALQHDKWEEAEAEAAKSEFGSTSKLTKDGRTGSP